MVTPDDVLDVLRTIDDPEMPLSIVDLGIVAGIELRPVGNDEPKVQVGVEVLPTFVGCPALPVIENEIRRRVGALPGVASVDVRISYDTAWSVDRITPAGRESLRRHGVTVPAAGDETSDGPPACPFCGSTAVRQESAFGPTRCRMIWHCETCQHPFDHLKRLRAPALIELEFKRPGRAR